MDAMNTRTAERIGLKLMKASETIQDSHHTLFKRHGLSAPQYNVLRILRGAGEPGLNCHEISERMLKRLPDITRLLDRLVDKDLVTRARSDQDRRVVISSLTRQGHMLLKKIDDPLDRQITKHFHGFSSGDLENLDHLLERLLSGR